MPASRATATDYNAESVACFDKHASNYAQKYFALSDYHTYYDSLLQQLPTAASRIVDLACGPGNVTAYLQQQRPELDYDCVDMSAAMLAQVQQRLPRARVIQADCRDLSQLTPGYDAAAFCFGLSYFDDADAELVLQQLRQILKPGAPLLLSTVAGDAANSGRQTNASGDSVISFFRSQKQINQMLEHAGFALILSHTIASPANASQISQDVVLLARVI